MRKIFFTICIISTVLASVTRYLAYTYCFDGEFFTDNNLLAWITILLCILPCIYPFFLYLIKKNLHSTFKYRVDKPTKILTFITAGLVSFGGYLMYSTYAINDLADSALITSISLKKPFFVATIALCVYVLIMSLLQMFDKIILFRKLKFMELIPMIWGIILIVYLYIYYASSLRVTEDIISIIGSASLLLACLNRGKIIIAMDEYRNCYKKMMIHTGVAFSMWISLFVSEIALVLLMPSYEMYIPFEIVFICASMSVILLVFCIGNNFKHRSKIKAKHLPKRYK